MVTQINSNKSCKSINHEYAPNQLYNNESDQNSLVHLFQRGALVALPFFSLYKPLGFSLSLTMGGLRTFTSVAQLIENIKNGDAQEIPYAMLKTAISGVSLAATFFAHPLGMIIITSHDLVIEIHDLMKHLQSGNYQKAMESCLKIINNALYLSLFLHGGLEISIASLAMQILLGLYYSQAEFKKGHYLEAAGHLLMSMVRGHQLGGQSHMLQMKWKIEKIVSQSKISLQAKEFSSEFHVGELGKKWQFPSDHLPVGAKVGNATIISWNVLNKNAISWIYENTQGLNGSMITELDKPSTVTPNITIREELVIEYLYQMMNNIRHDNFIIALQECSPEFIHALVASPLPNMGIVLSDPLLKARDNNIVLYDKNAFSFIKDQSAIIYDAYSLSSPGRPLMDLVFQEKATAQKFQIINTHLPGDPFAPGKNEFAHYLLAHSRNDCTTIGLGDMNFSEKQMINAFQEEAQKMQVPFDFTNLVQYSTIVGAYSMNAHAIDHIWVSSKQFNLPCKSMTPNEVLEDLQSTVDLLQEKISQAIKDFNIMIARDQEILRREYFKRARKRKKLKTSTY